MPRSKLRELRQLRDENAQLKKLVADSSLHQHMLQEIVWKKLRSHDTSNLRAIGPAHVADPDESEAIVFLRDWFHDELPLRQVANAISRLAESTRCTVSRGERSISCKMLAPSRIRSSAGRT